MAENKNMTDPAEEEILEGTFKELAGEDTQKVSVPVQEMVDAADITETVADETLEAVTAAEDINEAAEEAAAGPAEFLEDMNEDGKDAPGEGTPKKDAASERARKAKEKAAEHAKKAGQKAGEHAKKAGQKAGEVRESIKNWVPGPNLPNQLTIARICMIPVFVALLLWMKKPAGNILAMIVFILASLTDAADGYIARRYNYITTFGKFMDPLADKLLVCSALICLVDLGRIESWIVIIIIAREFIISGFRLIAVEKGVVIAANYWGKFKTVFQMLMVILMVANFGGFFNTLAQILKWIALALTVISLVTYLIQNRQVLKDVQ